MSVARCCDEGCRDAAVICCVVDGRADYWCIEHQKGKPGQRISNG